MFEELVASDARAFHEGTRYVFGAFVGEQVIGRAALSVLARGAFLSATLG